jgi:hypothetical protein
VVERDPEEVGVGSSTLSGSTTSLRLHEMPANILCRLLGVSGWHSGSKYYNRKDCSLSIFRNRAAGVGSNPTNIYSTNL